MSEPKQVGFSDKVAGAISYITVVPAIAFLILVPYKKSAFVRYHAWQSIFLNFAFLTLGYLLNMAITSSGRTIMILGASTIYLVVILWCFFWVIGAITALRGKSVKLPFIGNLAERQSNG
jgi:uncharacterized membrane protein